MNNLYAILEEYPLVLPFRSTFPTVLEQLFQTYITVEQALLTNLNSHSPDRNWHIIGSVDVKQLSNELATYTHTMTYPAISFIY